MADFTWTPSRGIAKDTTPKVRLSTFGDGYIQRVANGINNIADTWNLTFQSISVADADAIDSFLSSKQGVTTFSWRPPGESVDVNVICPKWSKNYESHISRVVNATFERVYG